MATEVTLNLTEQEMADIQQIADTRRTDVEQAAGELFTEALVARLLRSMRQRGGGQVVAFQRAGQ